MTGLHIRATFSRFELAVAIANYQCLEAEVNPRAWLCNVNCQDYWEREYAENHACYGKCIERTTRREAQAHARERHSLVQPDGRRDTGWSDNPITSVTFAEGTGEVVLL
jgi:hypothetical protein